MAKRPQGLNKASKAQKKQKTEKADAEISKQKSGENTGVSLEFDADIDPTNEMEALYAMSDSIFGFKSDTLKTSNKNLVSMLIHACDNILRIHDQNPIDNDSKIPEILPDRFHNIYALSLLSMARIISEELEEEDELEEDSKSSETSTKNKDSPEDFINAALERIETGLETNPSSAELFFTKGSANVLNVSTRLKHDPISSLKKVEKLIIKPLNQVFKDFDKASQLSDKSVEHFTTAYLKTIDDFFEIGDFFTTSKEICTSLLKGKDNKEYLEILDDLEEKCKEWAKKRYETLLKEYSTEDDSNKKGKAKSNTKSKATKAQNELILSKAHEGLAKFYSSKAEPSLTIYEELLDMFLDDEEEKEDDKEVKKLKNSFEEAKKEAIKYLTNAIEHFKQAEPRDTEDEENDGDIFALTAEAQISLGNLLNDEEREEIYKEAVHRLRIAQRLGAGDFSEQIRDLI